MLKLLNDGQYHVTAALSNGNIQRKKKGKEFPRFPAADKIPVNQAVFWI